MRHRAPSTRSRAARTTTARCPATWSTIGNSFVNPKCIAFGLQGPIYAESGGSHDDRKVSGDLERRIDAEVLRIVREAYQRAVSILVRRK